MMILKKIKIFKRNLMNLNLKQKNFMKKNWIDKRPKFIINITNNYKNIKKNAKYLVKKATN